MNLYVLHIWRVNACSLLYPKHERCMHRTALRRLPSQKRRLQTTHPFHHWNRRLYSGASILVKNSLPLHMHTTSHSPAVGFHGRDRTLLPSALHGLYRHRPLAYTYIHTATAQDHTRRRCHAADVDVTASAVARPRRPKTIISRGAKIFIVPLGASWRQRCIHQCYTVGVDVVDSRRRLPSVRQRYIGRSPRRSWLGRIPGARSYRETDTGHSCVMSDGPLRWPRSPPRSRRLPAASWRQQRPTRRRRRVAASSGPGRLTGGTALVG